MSKFAVIIVAAGKSSRFHDKHYKKPFAPLGDKAVWLHSAERFLNRDDVTQTIVVISPDDHEFFASKYGANIAIMGIEVVPGGAERADSVQSGLERVKDDIDFVAIHDAARPCIADVWIKNVFQAAEEHSAAILAVPVVGTLKKSANGKVIDQTVSREQLWEAQTPQVFARQVLVDAYARRQPGAATDDAQLVEAAGTKVAIVEGSRMNLKVTTRDDLKIAAATLKALPKSQGFKSSNPLDDMWR